jgi:hypothetical protein
LNGKDTSSKFWEAQISILPSKLYTGRRHTRVLLVQVMRLGSRTFYHLAVHRHNLCQVRSYVFTLVYFCSSTKPSFPLGNNFEPAFQCVAEGYEQCHIPPHHLLVYCRRTCHMQSAIWAEARRDLEGKMDVNIGMGCKLASINGFHVICQVPSPIVGFQESPFLVKLCVLLVRTCQEVAAAEA